MGLLERYYKYTSSQRTRLTKNNSARYEHALAHGLWVSFEVAPPHEHFSLSENASMQLFQKDNSLLDTHSPPV